MTTDVVTVSPDLSLQETIELLVTRHVNGVPVVAGGEVIGIISATDLLSFAASALGIRAKYREEMEWDADDGITPTEVRNGDEPPAAFLAALGTDTDSDISEQFRNLTGEGRNALEEYTVADAMNATVCSLPSDTPIDRAADFMRTAEVYRVLVIDGALLHKWGTKQLRIRSRAGVS